MYRQEHPTPQWKRDSWINLNGEWEFDFDFGKSARERELYKKGKLSNKITVPFCPESELSGIGYTDFIPSVCYRKEVDLKSEDLSGRVFLHFGAVDFHSYIYVNGDPAGEHVGGYSSFEIDITSYIKQGKNEIFVIAEDDVRSRKQPAGKQSTKLNSYGCYYTRTTGIWQTVWLEFVPEAYIKSCRYYPDITNGVLTVMGEVCGSGEIELTASFEGKPAGSSKINVPGGSFTAQLALSEVHLWEIGNGNLYDLELRFGTDVVKSYFGMREVRLEGTSFMLNNKPVFMKMVLDQGFYQKGIYTAETDEQLKNDILLSKAFGFNGARLHQKVFEKRFLYHCDKEGYMVWVEHGNWGMDYADGIAQGNFICEWTEILERDFNSPSVVGWCPFNETWGYIEKETEYKLLENAYKITKLYDKTRPCIEASGNFHLDKKEIHDVHDYEQNPESFAEHFSTIDDGLIKDHTYHSKGYTQPYFGEPIFISEYGGIKWAPNDPNGWGYGNAPTSIDEFVERYTALSKICLSTKNVIGFCYTQLYDVEQEQNGLYYYDRTPKFDEETIKKLKTALD